MWWRQTLVENNQSMSPRRSLMSLTLTQHSNLQTSTSNSPSTMTMTLILVTTSKSYIQRRRTNQMIPASILTMTRRPEVSSPGGAIGCWSAASVLGKATKYMTQTENDGSGPIVRLAF